MSDNDEYDSEIDEYYDENSEEQVIEIDIDDELEDYEDDTIAYDDTEEVPTQNSDDLLHEKTYVVLEAKEILKQQRKQLKEVLSALQLPHSDQTEDTMYIVLKSYQWNTEKLLSDFFEFGESKILEKCSLNYKSILECEENEGFNVICGTCMICTDDNVDLIANSACGHEFCADCWYSYFTCRISDSALESFIPCMAYKCNCIVNHSLVYYLLQLKKSDNKRNAEILSSYQKKRAESYVNDNPSITWCSSAPCCGRAIKLTNDDLLQDVECNCSKIFCFACGLDPHKPATCDMMIRWQSRVQEDTATIAYLAVSTRQCPKCKVPVDRISGCAHMLCYACNHRFCWDCMGPLNNHSNTGCVSKRLEFVSAQYENKLNDTLSTEIERVGAYFSYIDRYNSHSAWISEEHETREHSRRFKNAMSEDLEFTDAIWIDKLFKTLIESKRSLINYCIFAFYEFDMEQIALEVRVKLEKLSDFRQANKRAAAKRKLIKEQNFLKKTKQSREQEVKRREANITIYKNLYHNFLDQLDSHLNNVTMLLNSLLRQLEFVSTKNKEQSKNSVRTLVRDINSVLPLIRTAQDGLNSVITDKLMKRLDQERI